MIKSLANNHKFAKVYEQIKENATQVMKHYMIAVCSCPVTEALIVQIWFSNVLVVKDSSLTQTYSYTQLPTVTGNTSLLWLCQALVVILVLVAQGKNKSQCDDKTVHLR